MSGSFGSVRWNVCMHRLDFGSYSHPKEFLRNGVGVTLGKKSPLLEGLSSEEDRTHDTASSRTASPTHFQLSYSGPVPEVHLACRWDLKQTTRKESEPPTI